MLLSSIVHGFTKSSLTRYSVSFPMVRNYHHKRMMTTTTSTTASTTSTATTSKDNVRVRFAPSPTGSLHVGGARTALYNWLLAKKVNGKYLLRIEDTDQARSTKLSEASILNDLSWLNLIWDEGPALPNHVSGENNNSSVSVDIGPHAPYRQSERKHVYRQVAEKLIEDGFAYRCFCTAEELAAQKEEAEKQNLHWRYNGKWRDADPSEVKRRLLNGDPFTVRFRLPENKICFIDDVVRGRVTWDPNMTLGDFILLRSNGMPVYNFCVAVDDATMQISHVIRADEHLSNTLRQILILEAMGSPFPTYAHCSLILGSDRSKLSKRHGATSLQQFSEQGFLPQAMINYLANLGWNDGTDKEIYTPEELITAFDLQRIIKSPSMFDLEKLRWVNSQHIRQSSINDLLPHVQQWLTKSTPAILNSMLFPSSSTPTSTTTTTTTPLSENQLRFLRVATKIAKRDMVVLAEASKYVGNCLRYDLNHSIFYDEEVLSVLSEESFESVVRTLLDDYNNNKQQRFPGCNHVSGGGVPDAVAVVGDEGLFAQQWKEYMKGLGKRVGVKGKSLFHPVRFALTGRVSGPDVGDQLELLLLLSSCPAMVSPQFPLTTLPQRMKILGETNWKEAKEIASFTKQRLLEQQQQQQQQQQLQQQQQQEVEVNNGVENDLSDDIAVVVDEEE